MIHIAVVEDELPQQRMILDYAARYAAQYEKRIFTHAYSDGDELLEAYAPGKFDILLLDIQMKHLNGMAAAERIRAVDKQVVILFITNMVQYAVQGYGVQAMDFIVKPVHYESFAKKLDQAVQKVLEQTTSLLRIRTLEGMVQLDRSEILYVELAARKLYVHMKDHTYQCNESMQGMEEKLDDGDFFRCHVAYLINLSYVRRIDRTSALVLDHNIPVSKYRRRELLDMMTNYMGNRR